MTPEDMPPNNQGADSWRKGWESEEHNLPWEWHMLQEQVHHLESRSRRLRIALVALGALLTLLIVYQFYPREAPVMEAVRAKRLEIISPDGLSVVTLDSDKIGGRLAIRFNQRRVPPPPAAFLYAAPEGGAMQLYEPGENFFAFGAKVGSEGNGRIDLRGRGLQKGLELVAPARPEDGGTLNVYNAQGDVAATLPAKP